MEFLNQVKVKLLNSEARVPEKATTHSAGFDICSAEELLLKKHEYALISTGISLEMNAGMEAQVRPRSGLAVKHGITVLNSPGTIDSDYRGEVKVALINHSNEDFLIEKGMRIAQLIFSQVLAVRLEAAENLTETARGQGGFGSTGLR